MKDDICPFSRVIVARWAICPNARVFNKPAGKLSCKEAENCLRDCRHLDQLFRENARFVVGKTNPTAELTHAQLMRVRVGGILGMQRVLHPGREKELPVIIKNLQLVQQRYDDLSEFPYQEVTRDMQAYRYRDRTQRDD